ncbi:MAG: formate C-acetyltransferase/glycerol dehydratase family glycyl radical enzyme [Planctomycetota bacterium]|jgi:formate C-acetyltransferase|nr:formate C-acetyltransferase/glycerol dehydratase family glycyl radical enzyme [Planctomycetota bacterium]
MLELRRAEVSPLAMTRRIAGLKERMLAEPRYLSLEQALIVTEVYKRHGNESAPRKRSLALAETMRRIAIAIDPAELIVGNRTAGVRAGVVFPEAGISWIDKEIETLPSRPQDKFNVHPEDVATFREAILPFWKGKSLEDAVRAEAGPLVDAIGKVVKINQKDHAQGHICPNVAEWIAVGPKGLQRRAGAKLAAAKDREGIEFYASVMAVLDAACAFMLRYAELAKDLAEKHPEWRDNMLEAARICGKLAERPADTFHEAVQSMWFLFALLHLESNASSFSPGRADQYLFPYFKNDLDAGRIDAPRALEILEALWLKFNQIVYLRNSHSASFFAGFPIGFNVALGGVDENGGDATNELSYLFLKAQEHIGLPQPNLSARLHQGSPQALLEECARVIGKGGGMPQVFNDESIVPALMARGISGGDARNYAIVGCVELTATGNMLGWSDAAMFNLSKALELAMNDGRCLITGAQMGPGTGTLEDFETYADLEDAFRAQIDFFFEKMLRACEKVEAIHQRLLPSALLSAVIDDCLDKGVDVTRGGARYNLSGIQAIQVANVADSLAAVKKLVYDEGKIDRTDLLRALREDFAGSPELRLRLLNKAPKYGNDVAWVDEIGNRWISYFAGKFEGMRNYRGGPYHTGLYTVSAHVPMGANVGASADGRRSGAPLADGGMSAVYGRDVKGPTALLKSVSRIDSGLGSNGTLLNMKFLPQFFATREGIGKFASLLRAFVGLRINHVQFNVVAREDLLAAQERPEEYSGLTIRVAGYTAYFTELARELQDEIIARTTYEGA